MVIVSARGRHEGEDSAHVRRESIQKAEGHLEALAGEEETAGSAPPEEPEEESSLIPGERRGAVSILLREGDAANPAGDPGKQNNPRARFLMRCTCLWTAILVSCFLLSGCAIVTIPLLPVTEELQERTVEGEGRDKILLLDVSGVISEEKRRRLGLREEVSMVDELKEALQKAEKDRNVRGLILRINSPGGTVTASDIIHHELLQHKKRSGQRITACLMDVGTSGAYYLATAADEIVAHPTTVTGSIGVVAMKFNVQGLMSKIGVEQETIKSGAMKDLFSPFRPSSPEEQKILQTVIDTLHRRFVDVIVDGRKPLTREAVEKLADGRIYTADQALGSRLIDRIGYLDETITEMKRQLNLDRARVIVYHRSDSYKSTIYSSLQAPPAQLNLITINGQELLAPPGVRFMFLWLP